MFRSTIAKILVSIFVWILLFYFFGFIRNFGADSANPIREISAKSIDKYVQLTEFIGGFLAGVFYFIIESSFENSKMKKWSYWKIIVLKSILYFFTMSLLFVSMISFFELISGISLKDSTSFRLIIQPFYITFLVYFMTVTIVLNTFKQISQKFGPGVFFDLLRGKYHTPKIESKIFMFLDLKDSTQHAERIGHLKYSLMIQSCFYDLNEVLLKNKANIYQYVGDEAVLYWTVKEGIERNNCIQLYLDFCAQLSSKETYYRSEFGFLPHFKAGLHYGSITVTEVGIIKKEIAFHGDVLNTTSRIQDQCNTLDSPLLMSQALFSRLNLDKFKTTMHPTILLKGKAKKQAIISLDL